MSLTQQIAIGALAVWLTGACVVSATQHGKTLRGRANCIPVIAAAVVEAIVISLAIWG